eukprot:COSAG01_NODE_89_length_27311_cov_22.687061_13_plen_46_part_00
MFLIVNEDFYHQQPRICAPRPAAAADLRPGQQPRICAAAVDPVFL